MSSQAAEPAIRTGRFDIYRQVIKRSKENGGKERTVFHAWYREQDIPKPVCVVTVWEESGLYVEWVHVDEDFRRQRIATEVIHGIESLIGKCTHEGATEAGEAFVASLVHPLAEQIRFDKHETLCRVWKDGKPVRQPTDEDLYSLPVGKDMTIAEQLLIRDIGYAIPAIGVADDAEEINRG